MNDHLITDQYRKIAKDNLAKLYKALPDDLASRIGGERDGDRFQFNAFGEPCRIEAEDIFIGNNSAQGVPGLLISLYANHADASDLIMEPFKAFKDFPGSMPYIGAFSNNTEKVLTPHVNRIIDQAEKIIVPFNGRKAPPSVGGDFSFILFPLPKIALCYIFYNADEEFPASVTCLYSHNANQFIPLDGLADVGEYTSRKIIRLLI